MDCSTWTIWLDFQAQQEPLPRDGTQQEHLPRDGTQQEQLPRDGAQQEHLPRDEAQQEHLPRDGAQTETEEKVKLINGKLFLMVLCPEVGIYHLQIGWMLDIDLIPDLRSKGVKCQTLGIDTCK